MGISNNSPTMSYVHISGTSVVWNNELYMVQDFATNKKYIYWNADMPHQLNASNIMPNRSTKQYLVIVNDNGMHTLVPSTSDDFSISFEGNSNQAIRDRIFGLYEKDEEFGNKFVTIEQNIDGIKSMIGESEEATDGTLIDRISKIEQKADKIDLSVEEISKKYNDDKETNQLREDLNSSIIKLNSTLGTFKSELTDYFKNNEITSEEEIKIKTQLEILTNEKVTLEGYVDTVRLIAESNNQTQDVVAIDSAKEALQIAHDNLYNNVSNAIIDSIITPTENTIVVDSFAKYNLRVNELKNTCDDIIILGVGGVITEELANISMKSNEIKLSVSKVESDFKSDMSIQKLELEKQIGDVNSALGTFEETVNTTFKDGIIDESEKNLLQEKIGLIDKEKVDIDLRYNSVIEDSNLSEDVKTELTSKYNEYCSKHNELKAKIESVISDNIVNDAEKLNIDTLFKSYSNALAYFSALMNKAIEDISFNTSKAELEKAKEELNESIDGVKNSIEGIDKVLDGTFEDNILDEVERENIKQNLKNLSKEKLDIDKIYTDLYNNAYLLNQDKINLKSSYDNYVSKYDNVVKVSNDILVKEDLINNVDKANMDSAIANHNESLALFHVQANKSIDIIAANRINGAKNEINGNIEDLKGDIDGLNDYIDESFKDNILSEAEKSAIKQNLKTLETNKLNIDKQYNVVYNNISLVDTAKSELKSAYDNYVSKYSSLISIINNILNKEDLLVESDNTAINNAFKEHNSAMSIYSEKINRAIDSIALKNIEDTKDKLSKEIDELGGSLGDLEDTMNGAFKDGILSESEKQAINQHLLTVSSKKTDIDKRYATLYTNEYLEGTAKTNLTTAYNNYIKAYNSLVTVINNILTKDGLIDSTDKNNLDNAFKEHNNKLGLYSTADLNALDYIASKKAESESEKVDKKYAEILLNEDGIVSKVGRIETTVNEQGTTINKHESSINQMATSIESKVSAGDIASTINQTAQSVRINASKINLDGYATFSSLKNPGQTIIDGSNIKSDSLSINSISSNNPNPIIKLFPNASGYCSIDATKQFESGGKGTYVRLKWDKKNYFFVGENTAGIYLGRNDSNSEGGEYDTYFWVSTSHARIKPNKLMIGSGACRIDTEDGAIRLYTTWDGQGDRGLKINANSGRLEVFGNEVGFTQITNTSTGTGIYKALAFSDHAHNNYASSSHTHSNYASSSHTHSNYASSSHSHSGEYWNNLTINRFYGSYMYLENGSATSWALLYYGHASPATNNGYALGQSSRRWQTAYLVSSPNVSSDVKTKENIRYLQDDMSLCSENTFTTEDFYNFIGSDLKLAQYDYKINIDTYSDFDNRAKSDVLQASQNQIGFIAQDVKDTKVGSFLIKKNEDGMLSYNTGSYANVLAGALQYEIEKRDKEISQLNNKVDGLEDRIKKLEEIILNLEANC